MNQFLRKLRWIRQRPGKEAELREELQFHLEEETEARTAEGLPLDAARGAARRDLGNLTIVREDTRAAWIEKLAAASVPAAPVQDVGELAADPQLEATGILRQLGEFTTLGPAFSVDGERPAYRSQPPALGAHSTEILAEAGYSEQEISAMVAEGIIGVV